MFIMHSFQDLDTLKSYTVMQSPRLSNVKGQVPNEKAYTSSYPLIIVNICLSSTVLKIFALDLAIF